MALAFDQGASSGGGTWVSSVSSITFSKVNTGSNIILLCSAETYSASLRTVSGIKWDPTGVNTSLVKVDSITANLESKFQDGELWYLDACPSGTKNITCTFSGTADFSYTEATSYTGKTTTGLDASAKTQNTSASTTSPTNNVNVVHSDCWLVGMAYCRGAGPITAGTGTTLRTGTGGFQWTIGDSNGVVGTGNQTLAFAAGSGTWPAVVSCSISEANAGGGGGTTYRLRALLGVGT